MNDVIRSVPIGLWPGWLSLSRSGLASFSSVLCQHSSAAYWDANGIFNSAVLPSVSARLELTHSGVFALSLCSKGISYRLAKTVNAFRNFYPKLWWI